MNIKDRIEKVKDESTDDFEFEIKDAFSIKGRGTVVRGTIKSGIYKIGDTIFHKKCRWKSLGRHCNLHMGTRGFCDA